MRGGAETVWKKPTLRFDDESLARYSAVVHGSALVNPRLSLRQKIYVTLESPRSSRLVRRGPRGRRAARAQPQPSRFLLSSSHASVSGQGSDGFRPVVRGTVYGDVCPVVGAACGCPASAVHRAHAHCSPADVPAVLGRQCALDSVRRGRVRRGVHARVRGAALRGPEPLGLAVLCVLARAWRSAPRRWPLTTRALQGP